LCIQRKPLSTLVKFLKNETILKTAHSEDSKDVRLDRLLTILNNFPQNFGKTSNISQLGAKGGDLTKLKHDINSYMRLICAEFQN
jgi:hypothetical protein